MRHKGREETSSHNILDQTNKLSEDNIARQWWLSQIVDCLQHGAKKEKKFQSIKNDNKKTKYQKKKKILKVSG